MIALVIGHTYFAILPVNRPVLRTMVRGWLTSVEIKKRYKAEAFVKVKSKSKEEGTDEKQ